MVAALKSHSVRSGDHSTQIKKDRYSQGRTAPRPQPPQTVAFLAQKDRPQLRSTSSTARHLTPVVPLPGPPPRPLWLKLLLRCQQGTTVITGTLLVSVLALYSSTVSLNGQVNHGVQRLSGLQRDRQQLTTANEVLKHHMAEQAKAPGAGLHTPRPNGMLFLNSSSPTAETTHQQPDPIPSANTIPTTLGQRPFIQPLGY
ncbi:MAG: hypothetical protein AAFW84_22945 [Cyanobacteria bacterium J06635_15]